jgi:hypothetical protein
LKETREIFASKIKKKGVLEIKAFKNITFLTDTRATGSVIVINFEEINYVGVYAKMLFSLSFSR